MDLTPTHMLALLDARDNHAHRSGPVAGVLRCRNGEVRTEVVHRGRSGTSSDLFREQRGELKWMTIESAITCTEIADLVNCSHAEQKTIDGVLLGRTYLWRILITAQTKNKVEVGDITRKLKSMGGEFEVNSALAGIGRIEKSPYVVTEDPSLSAALDIFRENACDMDWVKRQVHGTHTLFVPENFPRDVPTPDQVLERCL